MRKIEGVKVTEDKGEEVKPNRRAVSVHRTIDSIHRRSNNHSIIENQHSVKARSNSCSLRKKSVSRPRSNNASRIQFTSQNVPVPEYQSKGFEGVTPSSNISAPTP